MTCRKSDMRTKRLPWCVNEASHWSDKEHKSMEERVIFSLLFKSKYPPPWPTHTYPPTASNTSKLTSCTVARSWPYNAVDPQSQDLQISMDSALCDDYCYFCGCVWEKFSLKSMKRQIKNIYKLKKIWMIKALY